MFTAETEVKWRTVLKDRARRYNLKVPDRRRRCRSRDRSSEEFDETLLKKARFDPKSFAQEFHESVLKDTREKLRTFITEMIDTLHDGIYNKQLD